MVLIIYSPLSFHRSLPPSAVHPKNLHILHFFLRKLKLSGVFPVSSLPEPVVFSTVCRPASYKSKHEAFSGRYIFIKVNKGISIEGVSGVTRIIKGYMTFLSKQKRSYKSFSYLFKFFHASQITDDRFLSD